MNLKKVFSLSLLMALPLAAAAQTNIPAPGQPQSGRPIQTRPRPLPSTNNVSPAAATAPPAIPDSSAAAVPANAADNAAQLPQLPQPVALPPNPAPSAAPEPADIHYNFTMPFEQVLDEIYAPLIGRTPLRAASGGLAVDKGALLTLKTQSDLTKSEAIMALETVMGMNGITVVPIGDKFFKVVTDVNAASAAGLAYTNTAAKLPDFGKFITEIVQLKYADPDQVVRALGLFAKSPASVIYIPSTASLILRDYTENVKRMLEMVEKLDVESALTIKSEVIPIRYALATDISAALSQLGAQGGGSVGRSTTGANFKPTTGTTSPGMGGMSPGGGTPYGSSTQAGLSGGAGGGRSNFAGRLGSIVSGAAGGGAGGFSLFGQTKIIADERTNSLLVFANDEDMKMIKKIIKQLDVVLAQVLIEAIILEVNLTDGKNFNFSILQNQSTRGQFTGAGGSQNLGAASSFLSGTGSGTNGAASGATSSILPSLPSGFSYFAKYGNDFNAVLEAVASDSRISVLSRPQIQTSHAVEAELFIGNTVPYVTGTMNYGYSTGPSVNYQQMEVGIRLRVLPLINPDGLVVMDIDQEIEQLGPSVAIPGAGNVPTTTKRDAGAKVAVMSGETVILGGFISASRSLDHSGVPWLMNIPLLGNLFKSSAAQNTRTELIVLMRPTVLGDPQIAARAATQQRDRMAAVKQAEMEIRRDEDQRNAVADKELQKQEKADAEKAKRTGQPAFRHTDDFNLSGTNEPEDIHLHDTNSAPLMIRPRP
jgi:general secretion pathway protein D